MNMSRSVWRLAFFMGGRVDGAADEDRWDDGGSDDSGRVVGLEGSSPSGSSSPLRLPGDIAMI